MQARLPTAVKAANKKLKEAGHRDARFTFSVYQRAAKRREKLKGRYLEAFDAAREWGRIGTKADSQPSIPAVGSLVENEHSAVESR